MAAGRRALPPAKRAADRLLAGWIWLEVLGGSFPASLARHPRSSRHPSERAKLNNVLDLRDLPEKKEGIHVLG